MNTKLFVNLPVKNLNKTKEFFSALGFKYNAQFTDDRAACMIVNDDAYVMLLQDTFFKTFTKKNVIDAANNTEVLVSFSADSRDKVDQIYKKAISMGAKDVREPDNMENMYGRSFSDPDGHIWEVVWMDPSSIK